MAYGLAQILGWAPSHPSTLLAPPLAPKVEDDGSDDGSDDYTVFYRRLGM
jgi:hypothetical protein